MDVVLYYFLAAGALVWSFTKDKQKTRQGIAKAWKAFENILPAFAIILFIIGIVLTLLSPVFVVQIMGSQSGIWGMALSAIVGSITLIPGFIAFPLAKAVLEMGAGITQIAVFISTLMMVGVVTAPLEIQFFSKKTMLLRNGMSFVFSFVVAAILGMVIA